MLWPRVYWQARCACMPAAAGRLRLSTVQWPVPVAERASRPLPRRDWVLPAVLLLFACLPLYRRVDSGLALLLHRAPQPGWRGAAMDALRTAAGRGVAGRWPRPTAASANCWGHAHVPSTCMLPPAPTRCRCPAGMRSLGFCLMACCHVLPPLPALLLHVGHTVLTWNPRTAALLCWLHRSPGLARLCWLTGWSWVACRWPPCSPLRGSWP